MESHGHHEQEDGVPAEQLHGQAAERRRESRTDRQDDADKIHDPGGALIGEKIAHQRPRDRHADRSADALQEARGDEHLDCRREQRKDAGR
jgi:hypothetical protein